LGVLWNRTEMSSHLNLEQADEGTWRRKVILRSQDLARKLPHKWLEPGGGRAWRDCLCILTNQKCLGGDVPVGSQPLQLEES
jgi:hypothetical protein